MAIDKLSDQVEVFVVPYENWVSNNKSSEPSNKYSASRTGRYNRSPFLDSDRSSSSSMFSRIFNPFSRKKNTELERTEPPTVMPESRIKQDKQDKHEQNLNKKIKQEDIPPNLDKRERGGFIDLNP